MTYLKEKKDVAGYMLRLYEKGLTTCSGGNISLKISDEIILITPSQTDKGKLKYNDIACIDLDGKNLTPNIKISMESKMHLALYKKRSDINAIVHAHPVFATAFTLSDEPFETDLTGETRAMLGNPAIAGYKLMGTKELAKEVAKVCIKSNVVLMKNHGILTMGKSLFEAYDRMELTEINAKMLFISKLMSFSNRLNNNLLLEIDQLFL